MEAYFANPEQEIWFTALEDQPIGVAYCAPEPVTAGTWNLRLLWIEEEFRGYGYGKALVAKVENELSTRHARLLIVETSQLPEFESARKFVTIQGGDEINRVSAPWK